MITYELEQRLGDVVLPVCAVHACRAYVLCMHAVHTALCRATLCMRACMQADGWAGRQAGRQGG